MTIVLALGGAVRADPPPLLKIRRASEEARYNDAQRLVQEALATGGRRADELVELYAHAAQLACILEGPSVGEQLYRRLLALAPGHAAPARDSPVVQEPFARARAWIATAGHLEVRAAFGDEGGAPIVGVRVLSDPLAMVARIRVAWRVDGPAFQEAEAEGLSVALPAGTAMDRVEVVVSVLDRAGNTLRELGSVAQPLRPPARQAVAAAVAPTGAGVRAARRRPLLRASIGSAVVGVVLLGAAIGLDVAAAREFDALERRCQGACADAELRTLHLEEGLAAASYALAGGGLTMGVVLLITDRVLAARGR